MAEPISERPRHLHVVSAEPRPVEPEARSYRDFPLSEGLQTAIAEVERQDGEAFEAGLYARAVDFAHHTARVAEQLGLPWLSRNHYDGPRSRRHSLEQAIIPILADCQKLLRTKPNKEITIELVLGALLRRQIRRAQTRERKPNDGPDRSVATKERIRSLEIYYALLRRHESTLPPGDPVGEAALQERITARERELKPRLDALLEELEELEGLRPTPEELSRELHLGWSELERLDG